VSTSASLLTFFSGFGLGTVLTPFYGLFFPLHLAVMMTALVHLVHSLSKALLLREYISIDFVKRFGVYSLAAAGVGAWALWKTVSAEPLFRYVFDGHIHTITLTKILVCLLLLFFVLWERLQTTKNITFPQNWLWLGGITSGFLGGFSGHQGALRTAVMRSAGLTKEKMVATSAAISVGNDLVRLCVYLVLFQGDYKVEQSHWLLAGIIGAIAGAFFGKQWLETVTDKHFEIWISATLILFAVGLGSGLIGQ
jgi:ABC-type amino acid transport system permease subunit